MKTTPSVLAALLMWFALATTGCDRKTEPDAPAATNDLRSPVARTGIPDDSIKPVGRTGVPDDSVKPIASTKSGVPDDSIKPAKPILTPPPPVKPLPVPPR